MTCTCGFEVLTTAADLPYVFALAVHELLYGRLTLSRPGEEGRGLGFGERGSVILLHFEGWEDGGLVEAFRRRAR